MIRTRLCDALGIEVPIIQAAIWPATSAELVAAVGEAGAIGSIGAVFGSADDIRRQVEAVRELTERPFIVNHVVPQLDEEAFAATLEARPAAVSFALGAPAELVDRAHDAGCRVIHQVHTVAQAREAAALGVDVLIAQGAEAGGQGMVDGVGTLALIPQVVDAIDDAIPVAAAGGVADGRGLAAVLAAGASGANVGTRFLASDEASAEDEWKRRIVASEADETTRFAAWAEAFPPRPGAYAVAPRVLESEFVRHWSGEEVRGGAEHFRAEIGRAVQTRTTYSIVAFTGQTAGAIHEVLPAGEIVRRMVADAEDTIARLRGLSA